MTYHQVVSRGDCTAHTGQKPQDPLSSYMQHTSAPGGPMKVGGWYVQVWCGVGPGAALGEADRHGPGYANGLSGSSSRG